jgi:hypothetical protein
MGDSVNAQAIRGERLRRHLLTQPAADTDAYFALFRLVQPVAPPAMSYPGSPPELIHRATFSASKEADKLRADRSLVKGRFLNGNVGYVFADDLELYATAFRKPVKGLNEVQQVAYDTLANLGPLTPRQLREETGLLNKKIMPALHRLQTAFLVHEDQPDEDWEREWRLFEDEWPDVDLTRRAQEEAVAEVVTRYLRAHFFRTSAQIKDWSSLPKRLVATVMDDMKSSGRVKAVEVEGMGVGWMLSDDEVDPAAVAPRSAFLLHWNDPLVRSQVSELKRRYAGREVLQCLLVDGEFRGAAVGHWRIGPYDIDDILLDLPDDERDARRDEILAAVATVYHPPRHNILRYAGEDL